MASRKRIHLAIGVRNIKASVADYSRRLGCAPEVVIPGAYALWRVGLVNFSIRHDPKNAGRLRHLGFEEPSVQRFTKSVDVNGITWERFNAALQKEEINQLWGDAKRSPRTKKKQK